MKFVAPEIERFVLVSEAITGTYDGNDSELSGGGAD